MTLEGSIIVPLNIEFNIQNVDLAPEKSTFPHPNNPKVEVHIQSHFHFNGWLSRMCEQQYKLDPQSKLDSKV